MSTFMNPSEYWKEPGFTAEQIGRLEAEGIGGVMRLGDFNLDIKISFR